MQVHEDRVLSAEGCEKEGVSDGGTTLRMTVPFPSFMLRVNFKLRVSGNRAPPLDTRRHGHDELRRSWIPVPRSGSGTSSASSEGQSFAGTAAACGGGAHLACVAGHRELHGTSGVSPVGGQVCGGL